MKIRLNKVLVLVLVLALMSTTAFAIPNKSNGIGRENAPGQHKFNDTEGWAEKYIERMAKKDVIKGVGNGAFMPSNTAKEIETVIMLLRLIDPEFEDKDGFGEDAELPEGYNGKKPADWMVKYIEKAYEIGKEYEVDLITVEDFDPNFPTKRSKAAVYFVRAADILDLDDVDLYLEEALGNDFELDFKDFNSIPEEHIKYVSAAYELGLIDGYPNNTFRANKAINRAELAAMMYRLDENYESDYSYSRNGKIEEINLDEEPDQITLKIRGSEKTFDISTNVAVYIEGEEKSLTDLAEGMVVEVTIFNNEIIDITVKSDDEFDIEDLEELVADAEALVGTNYTTGSWITFETALTEAGIVLDETYPTQEEVDEAYDNLQDAMNNLVSTVTDIVSLEEDVVIVDNENTELTVAFGTTVEELEDAVKSDFKATFTVLDESEEVADDVVEVTDTMVLEVTAEDDTVVEYIITVEEEETE